MKTRSPMGVGGIVALVMLAAGVAFYGLRSGTAEVTVDEGPGVTPLEDGSAVVAFLRESGGFSLLGLRFADSTHYVEVLFTTEPGCSDLVAADDPWPTPYPQCSTPVEMLGTVGGLGVTTSGRSLVGVQITVPSVCYQLLTAGMAWPTNLPECRPGQ